MIQNGGFMKDYNNYLNEIKKIFLFRNVEESNLRTLFADDRAEAIDFARDETIYDETHYRRSLGIILTGRAEVQTGNSGHTVILNRLEPPILFGAAGLFQDEEEYVTHIVALENSRILFIPQELLTEAMRQDFKLVENYIAFLSQRIRFLNHKISGFTQPLAEGKLARYLMDLSAAQNSLSISLVVSLQDVAKILNLGRASLYRALELLESSGYIIRKNKQITIQDKEALEALCI